MPQGRESAESGLDPDKLAPVEREPFVIATTERGRIAIAPDAIAQIVGAAAAESYGVVAHARRGRQTRLLPWGINKGVDVDLPADGHSVARSVQGVWQLGRGV